MPQEVAVAHEIAHAWRFDRGLEAEDRKYDTNMSEEDNAIANSVYNTKRAQLREYETTHIENIVRSELSESAGKDYGQRLVYGKMADTNTSNTFKNFSGKKLLGFGSSVTVPGVVPGYNYSRSRVVMNKAVHATTGLQSR